MTTYFVTTGDSLRRSSRCWKIPPEEQKLDEAVFKSFRGMDMPTLLQQPGAHEYFGMMEIKRKQILTHMLDRLNDNPGDAAKSIVADHFDPGCWDPNLRHLLPAEIATLLMMCCKNIFSRGHRLVFLRGKNNPRQASWGNEEEAWLLYAIAHKIFADKPKNPAIPEMDVEMHQPAFAWDPILPTNFPAAIKAAAHLIHGCEGPMCVVMTGGYKAVVSALAARLADLRHQQRNLFLYYLHEKGDEVIVSKVEADEWSAQVV